MKESLFPGYETIQKIGEGGMGEVYKARELSTNRIVAIKTLLARSNTDRSFERFLTEVQAYGRLNHPNIIEVYSFFQNPQPFLVMRYIDGQNPRPIFQKQRIVYFSKNKAVFNHSKSSDTYS